MTKDIRTTEGYFAADFNRTLFPLDTTRILVAQFSDRIKEELYGRILPETGDTHSFRPQQRCYAAKHDLFLRRTFKLDPLAEYFLYDVIYRNRHSFRHDHRRNSRQSFGYRFVNGRAASPSKAYGDFKLAIWHARLNHEHWVSTDIATYFNAIYHHDLVRCVRDLGWPDEDVGALGRFLREINSGRSVDCLPQGIHPAKVLGAEFLRFVDDSHLLKSATVLRFQDDIHIFDSDLDRVGSDLLTLQALLGEKGLSLNTAKTIFSSEESAADVGDAVEDIRAELLRRRRNLVIDRYGGEIEDAETDGGDDEPLTDDQVRYLLGLITSSEVEEPDAELVLTLLRDHGNEVLLRMLDVLQRFPGLSKNLYTFVRFGEGFEAVDDLVLTFLKDSSHATEFQLFWLTKLATDLLAESALLGEILFAAYEHPNATLISKAKVLEHPDKRFGLSELREEQLRSGRSDWLAWAAAAGSRVLKKGSRNHVLQYFANGSALNRFIAGCIEKLPPDAEDAR